MKLDVATAYDALDQASALAAAAAALREEEYVVRSFRVVRMRRDAAPPPLAIASAGGAGAEAGSDAAANILSATAAAAAATAATASSAGVSGAGPGAGAGAGAGPGAAGLSVFFQRRAAANDEAAFPPWTFRALAEAEAARGGARGAVFVDALDDKPVARARCLALLQQHVSRHLVLVPRGGRGGLFLQGRGVPQGSRLSATLFNLVMGGGELRQLLPALAAEMPVARAAEAVAGEGAGTGAGVTSVTAILRLTDDT